MWETIVTRPLRQQKGGGMFGLDVEYGMFRCRVSTQNPPSESVNSIQVPATKLGESFKG